MKRKILGVFVFQLIIIWGAGMLSGDIPKKENIALQALFNDTSGSSWERKDNWKNAQGTEPTWYGITCDSNNSTVLELKLPDNKLQGILPPDLAGLSNLITLDLRNNQLKGPIPSWIQQLKNLKKLDLSHNRFTGHIPSWIGNLKKLEVLILDDNFLEDPIPAALGNLSRLKELNLCRNDLTGEIPPALGKLSQLIDDKSDFRWNGIYTANTGLGNFLRRKQEGNDWESTQTIAPGGIAAVSQSDTSIILSWIPIAYTQGSGGYRVSYSTAPGGPYKLYKDTDDKTVSKMEVQYLEKSTTYYFILNTWTSPHDMNRNTIESVTSKEFPAATRGLVISGTVTKYLDENKTKTEALPGVLLKASNNGGIAETDKDGKYSLSVVPGWTGTVEPFLEGFTFNPKKCEYPPLKAKMDGKDYIAESNSLILGKVIYNGEGVAEVIITFESNHGETLIVKTDINGNYKKTLPYNWSGTVIPNKAGHRFKPEQKVYGIVTNRLDDQDYTVQFPKISGRVTKRGGKTGILGVELAFSNIDTKTFKNLSDVTKTKSDGNYENDIPGDWFGNVRPSKKGYIFYPPARDNLTEERAKPVVNFKAERDFKLFFVVSGNYMKSSEGRFNHIYGKGIFCPWIIAGYKFTRDIYVLGGYGFFSMSGKSEVLEKLSQWKQTYLTLGIGYYINISLRVAWKAEVGVMSVRYSEKAFGEKVPGAAIGMRIGEAVIYKVDDRLFTEISMNYLFASDTVGEISVKLGGLRFGVGLGVRF